MIVRRLTFHKSYKTVGLNLYRDVQTTQMLALRASDVNWRRVGRRSQNPLLRQTLMKDSVFVDVNDEFDQPKGNISADFLEQAYDEQIREFKDKTKKTRRIIMKKLLAKRPKEPNMLTFNERAHIRFLHKHDPVEWNVKQLSESFPALPWIINKILKNNWCPENEEKIKIMDETVLENWKKLKENKLEASQEFLDHLKKFINKRDNLEIQLKNPKFFPLPEMQKKLEWKSGALNSFLLKYEKEVEKLKENQVNVSKKLLLGEEAEEKLMKMVTMNECEEFKESFLVGEVMKINPKSQKWERKRPVTLQEMKENIFKKTEKENGFISQLEEAIVQKTLVKHDRTNSEIFEPDSSSGRAMGRENQLKSPEIRATSSKGVEDEIPGKGHTNVSGKFWRGRKPPVEKEDFYQVTDECEAYANTYKINELGSKLFGAKDEKEPEGENVRDKMEGGKTIKPVNYFNTERDNEIFVKHEKLLSETVFWNSRKRSKSVDAGFLAVNSSANPHIGSHVKTYFTYDYPLQIEIPENKREKGKLYRVKDCYYDDTGKFLYRVPGMTEE